MTLADIITVLVWVLAWALLIGGLTLVLQRLLRRSSIVLQICLVVVATVAVLIAGVISAMNAMFLSSSNIEVLWYILAIASAMAVVVALILGLGLSRYTARLVNAARNIGLGQTVAPERRMSSELAALAAELQRTSEKLEQSRQREAAVEAARRELVAWVSHDLRTPLASMKAMTEALEDGVVTDVSGYHRKIIDQADQMAVLVNDLMELSTIQSGSLVIHAEPLDLYDLVSDAIADIAPLARRRNLSMDGSAVTSSVVTVDGGLIGRVIRNLILNAVSYSPEGSTVWISTAEIAPDAAFPQGGVAIEVSDECGGIDEQDLGRLFETGWRKSQQRQRSAFSGAGVGLSTVAGIVAAHGGEVGVRNTGRGCCFTVRIPEANVPGALAGVSAP
ncbi:sensor histidine kinase [Psychromicrobium xiongbiense]|uniref:sensor histidine kinase n=1 Tax=Psychromicrobium xiongbiense TaxID=3051184 RepID=UPI0025555550|nr:HAMP domain-containing sensor histidine kinase [Psychromicrobium sp. YIM S02556]